MLQSQNNELEYHQTHIRYTPCAFEDCPHQALYLEPNGDLGYCVSHTDYTYHD